MPRLLVNPGSAEAWEIELKPGANSLGRGQENDFPIEHASVSHSHCQIIVMGRKALIRDAGSINGTFVDGRQVEEAQLEPGQLFQLGSVEMRYESDEAAGPEEAPPMDGPPQAAPAVGEIPLPPRLASPAAAFCKSHARSRARFACPKCGCHFCELCVSTRQTGGRARKFCRACGVECAPLGAPPARVVPQEQSFAGRLAGAFSYPFKGDGVILLAGGTVCYALLSAASFFAMFGGFFGMAVIGMLTAFGAGYLIAYLRRILTCSAIGDEEMPAWPEVSEFMDDILAPCLQLLVTALACFLPALALAPFVGPDHPWAGPARAAAILYGCICFPMAFMAVSVLDSMAAANPLLVIPSILRIPLQYLLTVLLLGSVLALRWAGDAFLQSFLPFPFLVGIVLGFVSLYLLTVEMRILGLLYLANKDRLGWFDR
ncbi:MAG TPA: FHA domain-containing protein [Dongiaceae bacterium]|nr:FHA domain-containing protein [Dongiaceae bacterium]